MSFIEALALVGTGATILGIFPTAYAIINNKTLKKESKLTREIIVEESRLTREDIKESREAIKEEGRLTREMIQQTTKYIGDLIAAQGGKVQNAGKETKT
jgi:hypothetical protein